MTCCSREPNFRAGHVSHCQHQVMSIIFISSKLVFVFILVQKDKITMTKVVHRFTLLIRCHKCVSTSYKIIAIIVQHINLITYAIILNVFKLNASFKIKNLRNSLSHFYCVSNCFRCTI